MVPVCWEEAQGGGGGEVEVWPVSSLLGPPSIILQWLVGSLATGQKRQVWRVWVGAEARGQDPRQGEQDLGPRLAWAVRGQGNRIEYSSLQETLW